MRVLAAATLGISLVLLGCGGDNGDGDNASQAGDQEPAETVAVEAEAPLDFLPARTKMTSNGCSTALTFRWKADDPASVPPDAEAVIKITGPRIAGRYKRRVTSGTVTLRLSTRVNRTNAEFTGRLVSVGGRSVNPGPPITHPFLNTACGPNPRPQPPSSLPPGTPVPGAPCVPGQPLPPHLDCG